MAEEQARLVRNRFAQVVEGLVLLCGLGPFSRSLFFPASFQHFGF
jgi:hypothetical protein